MTTFPNDFWRFTPGPLIRRHYVWVVEMKDGKGRWSPCADGAIARDDARAMLKEWKRDNPDNCFRLRKYHA